MTRFISSLALLVAFAIALSAAAAAADDPPGATVAGLVLDSSGAVVPGASITLGLPGRIAAHTVSDGAGRFVFTGVSSGAVRVTVSLAGFATVIVPITPRPGSAPVRVVLKPLGVTQQTTVRPDAVGVRIISATRTDTPLRDVPQAVSIVTREMIAAQAMQSLADVVRYVPGVGMAQGEGNRDAPIFRGNASTADFFVDGIRDDVQYYRDVYNVERVEVLKGPNAMLFGRGGAGGVLNRVTREATWSPVRQFTVQGGSFANRRMTVDVGQALSSRLAARVTGVYENSGSYRQAVALERYGLNPTFAATLGARTVLTLAYERFHDERTADRGIPSLRGRPAPVAPSVFFGDPAASRSRATVDAFAATVQHEWRGTVVRNRTRLASYDKFYQNVYPTGVAADGARASIAAYNNATTRLNFFTQTDVITSLRTGPVGHTLVLGAEFGRQATANRRNTGYFGAAGETSVLLAMDAPADSLPVAFRPSATDADNRGVAHVRAVYVQDQAALSRFVHVVAGLRVERFDVTVHNNRSGSDLRGDDGLMSPRFGVIVKPFERLSVYTNYSVAYLPRAGEQLSSLTLGNEAIGPERFRNAEAGFKWDVRRDLGVSAAVYRLDRRNVAVVDPTNPSRLELVKGQVTRGIELEGNGHLTRAWTMIAGYAFQSGRISSALSATALAGARLAQLPAHTFSLWNRYDVTPAVGAALGVITRAAMFASTDNLVVLPAFTRCDAAVYVSLTRRLRAQANVENLFGRRYYPSANGNNNITPGSPRAVRVVLSATF